jgi:hypothetical protein
VTYLHASIRDEGRQPHIFHPNYLFLIATISLFFHPTSSPKHCIYDGRLEPKFALQKNSYYGIHSIFESH